MGAETPTGALLHLEGVSKTYRPSGLRALDGVSLWVGARERVGLMGPSGSGKSTLANVAAGPPCDGGARPIRHPLST